ncbi:MAG: hypothetical protein HY331_02835 [Chloroflexi bacterium]|nr:hypothetical protein [Chloroflexota bacterium]
MRKPCVAALGLDALRCRRGEALQRAVQVGVPVGLASLGFFLFAQRYANEALRQVWQPFFLPALPLDALRIAVARTGHLLSPDPWLGWLLAIGVCWAGAMLVHRRRPAAVVVLGAVLLASIGAAMAQRYPFGEARTGHYLAALLAAFAGAGLGSIFSAAARASRPLAALGLAGLAIWWGSSIPWSGLGRFVPVEHVAPLVELLEASREPADVVALHYMTVYAYAYYSPEPWALAPSPTGFDVRFRNPRVMAFAWHRGDNAKYDEEARQMLERAGTGRIWFLASHAGGDEEQYMVDRLAGRGAVVGAWQQPGASLRLITSSRPGGLPR